MVAMVKYVEDCLRHDGYEMKVKIKICSFVIMLGVITLRMFVVLFMSMKIANYDKDSVGCRKMVKFTI